VVGLTADTGACLVGTPAEMFEAVGLLQLVILCVLQTDDVTSGFLTLGTDLVLDGPFNATVDAGDDAAANLVSVFTTDNEHANNEVGDSDRTGETCFVVRNLSVGETLGSALVAWEEHVLSTVVAGADAGLLVSCITTGLSADAGACLVGTLAEMFEVVGLQLVTFCVLLTDDIASGFLTLATSSVLDCPFGATVDAGDDVAANLLSLVTTGNEHDIHEVGDSNRTG